MKQSECNNQKLLMTHLLALEVGRKRYSSSTRFIHMNHNDLENEHTIPVYENICFVLALLKTKTMKNILEAKDLLERLFAFFTEEGFPVYLHEYPRCHSYVNSLKILTVFLEIHSSNQKILDEKKIRSCIEQLFKNCKPLEEKKNLDAFHYQVLLCFWKKKKINFDFNEKDSSEKLSRLFLISHFVTEAQRKDLIQKIAFYYHEAFGYIGPCQSEVQEKNALKPNLLDPIFSPKNCFDHPIFLQASLLKPLQIAKSKKINVEGWHIEKSSFFAYALKLQNTPKVCSKQEHIFRLLFKNHSFVLQDFYRSVVSKAKANTVWIEFFLKDFFDDISFYYTFDTEDTFRVNGKKGTTFQLGDHLEIVTKTVRLNIRFQKVEGEGKFFGHFLRGNRPSQKYTKNSLVAFDRIISLRSVRSKGNCRLLAEITINEQKR